MKKQTKKSKDKGNETDHAKRSKRILSEYSITLTKKEMDLTKRIKECVEPKWILYNVFEVLMITK